MTNELCTRERPPAREKPPAAIRSVINRAAHARALQYEKEERERMLRLYLETGTLPL
jgi:hypothetical protein